jgi:hypothetical protein
MKDRITPSDPIPVLQEAPPREFPRRAEGTSYQVIVNYFRRMRLNRVFPMVVELKPIMDKQAMTSPSPVQIRPVVPGALLTPDQREVQPGKMDTACTFYVTPLARGRLRDARLRLYQDGRVIQEVQLPMKGVRQRLTWVLLALTILLPCMLHYFTISVDLSASAANAKAAQAAAEQQPQNMRMPKADEMRQDLVAERYSGHKLQTRPSSVPQPQPGFIEKEIENNVPEPGKYIAEFFGQSSPVLLEIRKPAAHGIQEAYQFLQNWEKIWNLSGCLFLVLLALTLISWVTHSSRRSQR